MDLGRILNSHLMIGWACLAVGDGTRAGMNRSPTPKWMRRQKLELAAVASGGAGNLTARVWYSLQMASRGITRNTLRSVAKAFFWAMAVSITGARILSRPITRCTCGAGFIRRSDCNTLTIQGTTGTGDQSSCWRFAFMWSYRPGNPKLLGSKVKVC